MVLRPKGTAEAMITLTEIPRLRYQMLDNGRSCLRDFQLGRHQVRGGALSVTIKPAVDLPDSRPSTKKMAL